MLYAAILHHWRCALSSTRQVISCGLLLENGEKSWVDFDLTFQL